MTEALLQFIWQYQCFSTPKLQLVSGQPLEVLSTGVANTGGGPDFLGAQLVFDNLQWPGSVEVHFKSSYWYTHQHQDDPAYDGVILHVVGKMI